MSSTSCSRVNKLVERFSKRFGNAAGEFASIERFMGPVTFDHAQVGALDFFIGRKSISAFQAFTAATNARAIARLSRVDNFIITRAALGATHSVIALIPHHRLWRQSPIQGFYFGRARHCRAAAKRFCSARQSLALPTRCRFLTPRRLCAARLSSAFSRRIRNRLCRFPI